MLSQRDPGPEGGQRPGAAEWPPRGRERSVPLTPAMLAALNDAQWKRRRATSAFLPLAPPRPASREWRRFRGAPPRRLSPWLRPGLGAGVFASPAGFAWGKFLFKDLGGVLKRPRPRAAPEKSGLPPKTGAPAPACHRFWRAAPPQGGFLPEYLPSLSALLLVSRPLRWLFPRFHP